MQEGVEALLGAAADVGATALVLQQHPDFRRYAVSRAEEQALVDLAIDRAPQLLRDKNHFGAVVVDPMREIAANKVGALLDRFEARDLVDLKLLLGAGLTLTEVLQDAQQKHVGADPATLAWVLGTWRIPPTAALPEDTTAAEIEAFRDDLVRQRAMGSSLAIFPVKDSLPVLRGPATPWGLSRSAVRRWRQPRDRSVIACQPPR